MKSVLTETLRRLEHNGLVERQRNADAPPRVEYSLTTAGRDLLVPIRALGDWAAVYADQLPTENAPIRRSLRNGG
ncbi:winged helix-turn-helix transcriptional regulator [Kribbella sp. NPDC054772]